MSLLPSVPLRFLSALRPLEVLLSSLLVPLGDPQALTLSPPPVVFSGALFPLQNASMESRFASPADMTSRRGRSERSSQPLCDSSLLIFRLSLPLSRPRPSLVPVARPARVRKLMSRSAASLRAVVQL